MSTTSLVADTARRGAPRHQWPDALPTHRSTLVRTARGRRHCGGLFWNTSTGWRRLTCQVCCLQLYVSWPCGVSSALCSINWHPDTCGVLCAVATNCCCLSRTIDTDTWRLLQHPALSHGTHPRRATSRYPRPVARCRPLAIACGNSEPASSQPAGPCPIQGRRSRTTRANASPRPCAPFSPGPSVRMRFWRPATAGGRPSVFLGGDIDVQARAHGLT